MDKIITGTATLLAGLCLLWCVNYTFLDSTATDPSEIVKETASDEKCHENFTMKGIQMGLSDNKTQLASVMAQHKCNGGTWIEIIVGCAAELLEPSISCPDFHAVQTKIKAMAEVARCFGQKIFISPFPSYNDGGHYWQGDIGGTWWPDVQPNEQAAMTGDTMIASKGHSTKMHKWQKCLDVDGDENGRTVRMIDCDASNSNQHWHVEGSQIRSIRTKGVPRKCLDWDAGGAKLQLWDCVEGNPAQQWQLEASSIHLKDQSELCLAADGPLPSKWGWYPMQWAPVGVSLCKGGDNQEWRVSTSHGNWQTWHKVWQLYMEQFAALAQEVNADMLGIGLEINKALGPTHDAAWRELIRAVRKVYNGSITYGADKGTEGAVTWWDAVDVIGIDGYYVLAKDPVPADHRRSAFREAWGKLQGGLRALHEKYHKPIMFAEIAYRSANASEEEPSRYTGVYVVEDDGDQADLIDGLFRALCVQDFFSGLFWMSPGYDADLNNPHKGSPTGFNFAKKPGEQVVKHWQLGTRSPPQCDQSILAADVLRCSGS